MREGKTKLTKNLYPHHRAGHVAAVGQQGASGVVILDGKTLFKDVAIGSRF
jgi:hypothetical protein